MSLRIISHTCDFHANSFILPAHFQLASGEFLLYIILRNKCIEITHCISTEYTAKYMDICQPYKMVCSAVVGSLLCFVYFRHGMRLMVAEAAKRTSGSWSWSPARECVSINTHLKTVCTHTPLSICMQLPAGMKRFPLNSLFNSVYKRISMR